jgi:hypothetical protein
MKIYNFTAYLWVLLTLTDLGFQGSRTSTSSHSHLALLSIYP